MVEADLSRQLMIMVDNHVGSLAEVTSIISTSEINLIALCAYAIDDRVAIMFVTEDNNAAKKLLEQKGFDVQEEEVVLLTIENKSGSLQKITDKLADAGIDLTLIYGSVDEKAKQARIVLIAQNNLDVTMLVKTELERG